LVFSYFLKKKIIDIVQTYFKDGNKIGVLAGKIGGIKSIISTRRNQGYWHEKGELFVLNILNNYVNKFLANSQNTKSWVKKRKE